MLAKVIDIDVLGGVMGLSHEVMWRATVDCDAEFDGEFFYAVKTVGVYCRPSCKSKTPLEKNVRFFETGVDAENAGFRPCKRCRPDLTEYKPSAELAERIKSVISDNFRDRRQLSAEIKKLGVSSGHAVVVFQRCFQTTPHAYANELKTALAVELLSNSDMRIIDVAAESGFESLSAFNAFFKKQTGITPREYRLKTAE